MNKIIKLILVYTVIFSVSYAFNFDQKAYDVIYDGFELVAENKSACKVVIINMHHNRTAKSYGIKLNLFNTVNVTRVTLEGFRKFNNLYNLRVFKFEESYCKAVKYNLYGAYTILKKNGNFTLCPVKKGSYYITDFVIPSEKFPPALPAGDWKLESDVIGDNYFLYKVNLFIRVVYKLKNTKSH